MVIMAHGNRLLATVTRLFCSAKDSFGGGGDCILERRNFNVQIKAFPIHCRQRNVMTYGNTLNGPCSFVVGGAHFAAPPGALQLAQLP